MHSMRRSSLSFCLLTLVLCLLPSASGGQQPLLGEPAPAFELPSLDGKTLSLAGLRGKFVVLHFAASW